MIWDCPKNIGEYKGMQLDDGKSSVVYQFGKMGIGDNNDAYYLPQKATFPIEK